jgi:hypothetical protein
MVPGMADPWYHNKAVLIRQYKQAVCILCPAKTYFLPKEHLVILFPTHFAATASALCHLQRLLLP